MNTVKLPTLVGGLLARPMDPVDERPAPEPVAQPRPADATPLAGSNMAVYLPWVDLLRFLACVLVIYSHATLYADRVPFGHAGVALFFSISGYLIGTVLRDIHGQPQWAARFYVNRFLRIYPPLLAGLAFFALLAAFGLANKPGTLEAFLRNVGFMLTFTQPLSPDDWVPYGIVWTLCVEEWFYLLLPVVFLAAGPKRAIIVLLGLLVLTAEPVMEVIPGTTRGTWFVWPVNLIGGAVLALANLPARSGFPWVGLLGLGLLLANAAAGTFHPFGPVMGVVTTATVWSFATTTTRYPVVLNWALFAGKRSYGIYLLHVAAVSIGIRLARLALDGQTSGLAFDLIACSLAIGLSVLAAAAMWRVYEGPILNFRKRVRDYPAVFWSLLAVQLALVPAGIVYWLVVHGRG